MCSPESTQTKAAKAKKVIALARQVVKLANLVRKARKAYEKSMMTAAPTSSMTPRNASTMAPSGMLQRYHSACEAHAGKLTISTLLTCNLLLLSQGDNNAQAEAKAALQQQEAMLSEAMRLYGNAAVELLPPLTSSDYHQCGGRGGSCKVGPEPCIPANARLRL